VGNTRNLPQAPYVSGGGALIGVVSTGSTFNTNKADMNIVRQFLQPGMYDMMRNNTGWQRMFSTITFRNKTGVTHTLNVQIGYQQGKWDASRQAFCARACVCVRVCV
jgi:hypothetical protein